MTALYAPHASQGFNRRLHYELKAMAREAETALGPNLEAVVLGGGYGRGEGACTTIDGLENPYNDIDGIFVVKSCWRARTSALEEVKARSEARLGVPVDFGRPVTQNQIRTWENCLMWHDLLNGHQVLLGPPDIITSNAPAALRSPLPGIEAARLLLNRGAGLLEAMRVAYGAQQPADPDFVRRNYYKVGLALGDALLIAHGRFTSRYAERAAAYDSLGCTERVGDLGVAAFYRASLRFKFCPDSLEKRRPCKGMLREAGQAWERVFLYTESQRTRRRWDTAPEYVSWSGIREQNQHRLVRRPVSIARSLQSGIWSLRHPREWLYRRLPSLLSTPTEDGQNWGRQSLRWLQVWRKCA